MQTHMFTDTGAMHLYNVIMRLKNTETNKLKMYMCVNKQGRERERESELGKPYNKTPLVFCGCLYLFRKATFAIS